MKRIIAVLTVLILSELFITISSAGKKSERWGYLGPGHHKLKLVYHPVSHHSPVSGGKKVKDFPYNIAASNCVEKGLSVYIPDFGSYRCVDKMGPRFRLSKTHYFEPYFKPNQSKIMHRFIRRYNGKFFRLKVHR